ncbi:cell wall metabolism sensor histidine kinase WalK [Microbacterium sp. T2.11-28]|uniref:sensor histidine kinase n=1 Tax=Microbacterium sp. T2.11-28 TaxID=3041169 RepID=UPI00247799A1|nr:HAMP domain-containing sensor histidine kinase [Microbacterium sp. T2.11-28]CAI9390287.1 Sensor histidine kinase RcsC [Microbacterium sp. T2.11-28]
MRATSEPGGTSLDGARAGALNTAIRVLIGLTVLVNVLFVAALLVPGNPAPTPVAVLSLVAQWVPVGVFWLVAVRTRFTRPEVLLAAAAVTFNAAGDTFYALAMDSSGTLPSPSLADLGYLLYYPLTMAALLVLVVRQSQGSIRSALFDGAVASLGAAAVLAVILAPVFSDATRGTTVLDGAIAALYPLFDLLLITAVVAISASPVLRLGPRWQFLVAGFLLFAGADIAYALLVHHGAYAAGTLLDALWPAGVACAAIWVDGVTRLEPDPPPAAENPRTLPVPALAVLAGLGVLLVATQTAVPAIALVLAAATVVLAAVSVLSRHAALARMLASRERLLRQLEGLDRAKSDMIRTMSHEMRTPLTSILGYLDLVLDDEASLPTDTRTRLWVIERHARRLQDLAGDMLLLERLEAADGEAHAALFDLDPVLHRVDASLRTLADSRDVRLALDVDAGTTVDGDEGSLEQALAHVVENAVKFTPARGEVRVEVRPGTAPDGSPRTIISVTDTGMGIPADEVPQVFDRFFRASNAQDQAVQGTGLGLAIVREVVRVHGGDVSVTSVLGEGTVVRITLPAPVDEER